MKKDTRKYMIYFFGALGGLLYGYDTGVISGALLFINNDIPLTTLTEGLVVSMLLLGAIFGSALSGTCSDRWGRRKVACADCRKTQRGYPSHRIGLVFSKTGN